MKSKKKYHNSYHKNFNQKPNRKSNQIPRSDNEPRSFKNKVAEISEIPKDVILGMPVITLTGQLELNLENYRGILEYTDALIRIQTKIGQIKITGKNLQVAYYTNDEMKVTGRIESVEYQH